MLNTPLPIFNRLTWTERDTIATQSEATTSTLRGSADYLEPNQSLVTPESLKSTDDGWTKEGYSSENSLAEPLLQVWEAQRYCVREDVLYCFVLVH